MFYGEEVLEPFTLYEGNEATVLKKDFVVVDNPFMLSYVSKAIGAKLYKYILDQMEQREDSGKIRNMFEELKYKFIDVLVDLNLDLGYNESINESDFLKILTPKLDFVDFEDILRTYKRLIDVLSRLNLYKFIVLVNLRRFLSETDIVELYKYAKVHNTNLIILENENKLNLLEYENKLLVDEDLFETSTY